MRGQVVTHKRAFKKKIESNVASTDRQYTPTKTKEAFWIKHLEIQRQQSILYEQKINDDIQTSPQDNQREVHRSIDHNEFKLPMSPMHESFYTATENRQQESKSKKKEDRIERMLDEVSDSRKRQLSPRWRHMNTT